MNLDNAICLSLWQPWASAVALSLKRYETRSWSTKHRGPLLIHAAKHWTSAEQRFHLEASMRVGVATEAGRLFAPKPPLGCIVAVARLSGCLPTTRYPGLTELERLFGDFSDGRFAWQLGDVVRLPEPVPCSGGRRLWCPSAEVLDAVRSQMTEAAC